jgi:hypothetical protein
MSFNAFRPGSRPNLGRGKPAVGPLRHATDPPDHQLDSIAAKLHSVEEEQALAVTAVDAPGEPRLGLVLAAAQVAEDADAAEVVLR